MDNVTSLLQKHYEKTFAEHGATSRGVDWGDPEELRFRYGKMLDVLNRDFERPKGVPSLLDIGCGWGGLMLYAKEKAIVLDYYGVDIVESMIDYCHKNHKDGTFTVQNIFDVEAEGVYDYVVCNGILTQKLTAGIVEMEAYSRRMMQKMFRLCRYGMSLNFMSTRVNFMVNNLYYQNPAEILNYCFTELSPKVRIDHGYSSLKTGRGKLYEFTVYVYKD
jgi:hypothetical protein